MATRPGVQTTLCDFGVGPADLLDPLTDPPTYLFHNDRPTTEPTYLADVPPAPPREAPLPYEPPGEQATLDRWSRPACPFCDELPDSLEKHLLLEHPDEVNRRLAERAADRPAVPQPATDGGTAAIATPQPAMFGEVEVPQHDGQRLDAPDSRACTDCGQQVSHDFARVFGFDEPGVDVLCRDCNPRSQRFTNDPTYGDDHVSHPGTVTGSSNPRSHANGKNS